MATPYSPAPYPGTAPETARISIAERLIPSISFAVASVSGAVGAYLIIRLFEALRRNENAGLASVLTGMMQLELIVGGVLTVAMLLGGIAFIILVIRMFTTNKTASPAGIRLFAAGFLSLISPALILYSASTITDAVSSPTPNISNTAKMIDLLNYGAFGATGLSLLMLMIFSFVPFRSRLGRKYSAAAVMLIIEAAIVALASLFFWLANGVAGTIQRVG